jgi:hypothetical protein
MKAGRAWTLQSLLTCVLWNGILVAILYFVAYRVIQGLDAWVTPLMQPEVQNLPEDIRGSLASFKQFLDESRTYLLPVLAGTGGTITLVLWLFLALQGRALPPSKPNPRPESVVPPLTKCRSPWQPPHPRFPFNRRSRF